MATIYSYTTGTTLTDGLQGRSVCDEAIRAAWRFAREGGEPVVIEDDGTWIVQPDGTRERDPDGYAHDVASRLSALWAERDGDDGSDIALTVVQRWASYLSRARQTDQDPDETAARIDAFEVVGTEYTAARPCPEYDYLDMGRDGAVDWYEVGEKVYGRRRADGAITDDRGEPLDYWTDDCRAAAIVSDLIDA